jgi:hypothetical protein
LRPRHGRRGSTMPDSPMLTNKAIGKGRDALYASRDGGGTMHTAPAEVVRAFLATQDRDALAKVVTRALDRVGVIIVDAEEEQVIARAVIDALLGGDPER